MVGSRSHSKEGAEGCPSSPLLHPPAWDRREELVPWLWEPSRPPREALPDPSTMWSPSQGSGGSQAPEGISPSRAPPYLALGFGRIPASFVLSRHGNDTVSSWKGGREGVWVGVPRPPTPRSPPTTPLVPAACWSGSPGAWRVPRSHRHTAGSRLSSRLPGLIGSGAGAGPAAEAGGQRAGGGPWAVTCSRPGPAWALGPAPFPR